MKRWLGLLLLPFLFGFTGYSGGGGGGSSSGLPFVDVTAYGVTCDGVTDDTIAMKAAFDSVTSRRGHYVFPAGNCLITDEMIWHDISTSGTAGGVIIEGYNNDKSRITYTGTGYGFAFSNEFGGGKDIHDITIRDISIFASSGAMGAILASGVERLQLDNVRISNGGTTTGRGLVLRNTLFSSINKVSFDSGKYAITCSGVNCVSNVLTALKLQQAIGLDFTSAFGANALCWATDEPYDCCTGAGTGDSAGFGLCGADGGGGNMNTLVDINCRITSVDQCAVFGTTASLNTIIGLRDVKAGGGARTSGIDFNSLAETVIGSEIDTDPIGAGNVSFYSTAYSGNDSTIDPDQVYRWKSRALTTGVLSADVNVDIIYDADASATNNGINFQTNNIDPASATTIANVTDTGVGVLGGLALRLYDADSSAYVPLTVPAVLASNPAFVLPPTDGDAGDVLCNAAGDGVTTWCAPAGGVAVAFKTIDASSGTDPVADTATDTLIVACTAPLTCTGDSAADSLTIALGTTSDCSAGQFVKGIDANLVLDCATPAGSAAFSAITGSTNTTAAMVIGAGASLATTSTGTNQATSVDASGVTVADGSRKLIVQADTAGTVGAPSSGYVALYPISNDWYLRSNSSGEKILYRAGGTDVAIADGGTGQSTQTAGFNALDPLTTVGDILTHDGTDSVRLANGTAGKVLTAVSAAVPAWTAIRKRIFLGADGCEGAITRYIGLGNVWSATESEVTFTMTEAATFVSMYCGALIDTTCTETFTLRTNHGGSMAASSLTYADVNGTKGTVTATQAISAGELVSLECVALSTCAAGNIYTSGCIVDYTVP